MLVEKERKIPDTIIASAKPRYFRERISKETLVATFLDNGVIRFVNKYVKLFRLEDLIDNCINYNVIFCGSSIPFHKFLLDKCNCKVLFSDRELVNNDRAIYLLDNDGNYFSIRKGNNWGSLYFTGDNCEVSLFQNKIDNILLTIRKTGWDLDRLMPPARLMEDLIKRNANRSSLADIAKGEIPYKTLSMAYNAFHGGRMESFALGHFTNVFDYDLNCLPAGTKVLVKKIDKTGYPGRVVYGTKNIENIIVGDEVITYNDEYKCKEVNLVSNVFSGRASRHIMLRFSNLNEIKLTEEHRIAIINNKGKITWELAKNVKIGDKCLQGLYPGLKLRLYNIGKRGKTLNTLYDNEKSGRIRSKRSKDSIEYWSDESNRLRQSKKISLLREDSNSLYNTKKYIDNLKNRLQIQARSPSGRKIRSKIMLEQWADENSVFNKKERFLNILHKSNSKPNSLEKELSYLLRHICPGNFRYNGDGRVMTIKRKAPDFVNINGQKKCIEVFTPFYKIMRNGSVENYINTRKKIFEEAGYQTLFIEDCEFNDRNNLSKKILSFLYNTNIEIVDVIDVKHIFDEISVYNIETENGNYFANGILVHNSSHYSIMRNLPAIRPGFVKFIDSRDYCNEAILGYGLVNIRTSNTCPLGLSATRIELSGIMPRLYFPIGESISYKTKSDIDFIRATGLADIEILDFSWIVPIRELPKPFRSISGILEGLINNSVTHDLAKAMASMGWGKFISKRGGSLWNPIYAAEISAQARIKVTELALRDPDSVIAITIDGITTTKPILNLIPNDTNIGDMKLREYSEIISFSDFYRQTPRSLDNWEASDTYIKLKDYSATIPYVLSFGGDLDRKISGAKVPFGSSKRISPKKLSKTALETNQFKLKPPSPEEAVKLFFTAKDIIHADY